MSISTEYSVWLTGLCALIAIGAGWLLYRNNPLRLQGSWAKGINLFLLILRSTGLFMLLVLLLGPLIRWNHTRTEKPVIAVLVDNSSSIAQNKDSLFYRNTFTAQLKQLEDELSGSFEVRPFTIGQHVTPSNPVTFDEKRTNLSAALEDVNELFEGRNLGGLVVASDGLYNAGTDPLQALQQLKCPVYTIALGDTTPHNDAAITRVRYNKLVFLDNRFSLQADVRALGFANKPLRISVMHEGKELSYKVVNATGNRYFGTTEFLLDATREGILHYTLRIQPLPGEATTANNSFDVVVQVIRNKQRVVILAQAPHPDIRAMVAALSASQQYEVSTVLLDQNQVPTLDNANLIIAYQLPGASGEGLNLLRQLHDRRVPALFVLGAQTGYQYMGSLSGNALAISANRAGITEALPLVNTAFSLFTLSEDEGQHIRKYPPLLAPYGNYRINGDVSVLLQQQIGNVPTNYPLLCFTRNNGVKQGFLCGEGFWKWCLYDYGISGQQTTQTLMNKVVQYLAEKKDASPFQITCAGRFDEADPVVLSAEIYNASNERITSLNPVLTVRNQQGKVFSFAFTKTENGYTLDAGTFVHGTYTYESSITLNNKIITARGKFVVTPTQLEQIETVANHQLLNEMASVTGGQLVYPQQTASLAKQISSNTNIVSISYQQEELRLLIQLKTVFFILLGLLTLEWFIRKWNGSI